MDEENILGAPPEGLAEFVNLNAPNVAPQPNLGAPGTFFSAAVPPPSQYAAGGEPIALDASRTADLTEQLTAPVPTPGIADNPTSAAIPPEPAPGVADAPKTTSSSSSSSSTEKGYSGLSDEAIKRQNKNIDAVAANQAASRDAAGKVFALEADQADRRGKQLIEDAARGVEKTAAELAVKDHIQGQVDAKLKAGSEWRPDRAELFGGDHGAAFGISAAIAAMAGAWMQARGLSGNNPYLPVIMKMIDDNVNDQVRRNTAVVQRLKEEKGDLKAASLALKQRLIQYADQKTQGILLREKSEIIQAKGAETLATLRADHSKVEAEQRKALERTETAKTVKSFSSSSSTAAGGPGTGKLPPERSEAQGKARAVQDAVNNYGTKAGLIRNPRTGQWEVGEGALPPAVWEKINPFSDNSITAAAEAAVEAYGRMQSGGVIGSEERPAFREQLGLETQTRAQLAARLNATEVTIRARMRSTDEAEQKQTSTAPSSWK